MPSKSHVKPMLALPKVSGAGPVGSGFQAQVQLPELIEPPPVPSITFQLA